MTSPAALRWSAAAPAAPPLSHPLARVLDAQDWARLPPAIAARFAGAACDAAFAGEGSFEANWIGAVFAAFGVLFGRPLPLRRGRARVFIRVCHEGGGEHWTRCYDFGAGGEIVRSVKQAGDGAWLEERAGPVIMRLRVFEEHGALVFESIDFRLRLAGFEVRLPVALTPGRIRVEHRDHGGGRFGFTLEARHPWYGRTFHQTCAMRDLGALS